MADIKDLFEAYSEGVLPTDGGYIVTVFFDSNSNYTKFEVICYGNVKDIYPTDEGITFQADGRKIFGLFEPVSFARKTIEPCYRDDAHKIPYRFKEVETLVTKRQDKIYIGLEPVDTYTAFTVLNETGYNESYSVTKDEGSPTIIGNFLTQVLWKNVRVAKTDSTKAGDLLKSKIPMLSANFGFGEQE